MFSWNDREFPGCALSLVSISKDRTFSSKLSKDSSDCLRNVWAIIAKTWSSSFPYLPDPNSPPKVRCWSEYRLILFTASSPPNFIGKTLLAFFLYQLVLPFFLSVFALPYIWPRIGFPFPGKWFFACHFRFRNFLIPAWWSYSARTWSCSDRTRTDHFRIESTASFAVTCWLSQKFWVKLKLLHSFLLLEFLHRPVFPPKAQKHRLNLYFFRMSGLRLGFLLPLKDFFLLVFKKSLKLV